MSLVYDKGKYKYSDIEQIKQKNNLNSNKAHLNLNFKKGLKTNSNNNSKLYNEIGVSSPIRNINNNKKNTFLTTYQNYSNVTANTKEYTNIDNNNKKNKISQKLKYNKSFEGNLLNNDLIFSNNFELGSDELYTIPHERNKGNKKFCNNSVILNNNKHNKTKNKKKPHNKSITKTINTHNHLNKNNYKKNNFEENLIITKLDEKFKNLENNIIDKKYENDIDHDEMIISTKKKNVNIDFQNNSRINTINKINNKNLKLSEAINEINNNTLNYYRDDKSENIFMNIFTNKNNIDFDENYLINTSFENNRNDFNIMYTEHYEESVMDDMLSLEIKLLIEKMLDIQKSYHKELNLIISQYNKNKKIFKILIEKIKSIQKKIYLIKKIKDNQNIEGNIYNFIGVYNQNSQHETNKINKNEFILWKNIIYKNDKRFSQYNKEKIKDLFKKTIFDKYIKLCGKLNNIENKIILNLMKKYRYSINKNINGIKSNGSNEDIIIKKDKNKVFTASPIQSNKKIIKQNKNINSNINNKKKHKKTSSCYQAKPDKYIYFKNSKLK